MKRSGVHPGWAVAGVTFAVLMAAAGIRAIPGVLMVPREQALGCSGWWSQLKAELLPAARFVGERSIDDGGAHPSRSNIRGGNGDVA